MEQIQQIQDYLLKQVTDAENGNISYLDALLRLEKHRKGLELCLDIVKSFKDDNFDAIATESAEYKDGYNGFKIEARNGGISYSFKNIPGWLELEKQRKEIEAKAKQAYLSYQKGLMNVDQDGVEVDLPEISYRKSSIIIKEIK